MKDYYKISDLQKALMLMGIDMSVDNIRKLERAGIIMVNRDKSNNYRYYTRETFKQTLKNLLLWCFYTPAEEIKDCNTEYIKEHIKRIQKAVNYVRT